MSYFSGTIAAVPAARKQDYIDHATAMWKLFQAHGASRMVGAWGVDAPTAQAGGFQQAVEATDGEAIVFSWVEWPDRETADAEWVKMQDDPAMEALSDMPFDGSRMIYGGFSPVFQAGEAAAGGYYQGFALPVPEGNKAAYVDAAEQGWRIFSKSGALGMVEAWGEDVPHGQRTDFYRATRAGDGDVPVFSWIAWPDRAACDASAAAMEAGTGDMDMSDMPFDTRRMMWAGFEPVFDSGA